MKGSIHDSTTLKYLRIIGSHLQEGHAALMVGAGFGLNADKIDESVGNIPLWNDLKNEFIDRLAHSPEKKAALQDTDPLTLAEQFEVMYGRPELDRLLLDQIRDDDYLPSSLYYQLLSLPWSDIFTTNYDTLLERTSKEVTEIPFRVVREKEDLVGSSGITRIVKLHGTFPSHRPFIITAEDYRTYPEKFAPFVNTVQQSLLENTLCLIGFSGNDPNFQKWIGWIRDNLGKDNCPQIYMLTHRPLSEIEVKMLYRKNVIPVDLSQLSTESSSPYSIYQKALINLSELSSTQKEDTWPQGVAFYNMDGSDISLIEATDQLKLVRESYPGWLTVPAGALQRLQSNVLNYARHILFTYCKDGSVSSAQKLDYLYEYNWIHEKSLLPIINEEWDCYLDILNGDQLEESTKAVEIQLAMLRTAREDGNWNDWDDLYKSLIHNPSLNPEQMQQLFWEKCLCNRARYKFQEFMKEVEHWNPPITMPLWCLRKAGLLAECGKLDLASDSLGRAISEVRRRLSHLNWADKALLSLESALMELRDYVKQVQNPSHRDTSNSNENSNSTGDCVPLDSQDITLTNTMRAGLRGPSSRSVSENTEKRIDEHHQTLHRQHEVSWREQNTCFTGKLEGPWIPLKTHSVTTGFDFGSGQGSFRSGPDKDVILAYSFLRFREETGIPFQIMNVRYDKKAACGAAKRIACGSAPWSILTMVRANAAEQIGEVITRALLSEWSREEADKWTQFYLEALLHTEQSITAQSWLYKENFACLAANVLPEVLSELCTKCSYPLMQKLLDWLETVYHSPKRLCYQRTFSLMKRLMAVYPKSKYKDLFLQLLRFLVLDSNPQDQRFFPSPLSYVTVEPSRPAFFLDEPIPEIDLLLLQSVQDEHVQSQLLHCLEAGLLTESQAVQLRDTLWDGQQFHAPKGWLSVVCLSLPSHPTVDCTRYLCRELTERVQGYMDKTERPQNDVDILNEINAAALSKSDAFTPEEITNILCVFRFRLKSLSSDVQDKSSDFLGYKSSRISLMYSTAHSLWLLTQNSPSWKANPKDRENMEEIRVILRSSAISHYGIAALWQEQLVQNLQFADPLTHYLCSPDKKVSEWGYRVLAVALRHSQYGLLPKEEIDSGIAAISHQIMWSASQNLLFALQAMTVAIKFCPNIVSSEELSDLLIGLHSLVQKTKISIDDAAETVSEKGLLRINAGALAKVIKEKCICNDTLGVLDTWTNIIESENEFGEIRNQGN